LPPATRNCSACVTNAQCRATPGAGPLQHVAIAPYSRRGACRGKTAGLPHQVRFADRSSANRSALVAPPAASGLARRIGGPRRRRSGDGENFTRRRRARVPGSYLARQQPDGSNPARLYSPAMCKTVKQQRGGAPAGRNSGLVAGTHEHASDRKRHSPGRPVEASIPRGAGGGGCASSPA